MFGIDDPTAVAVMPTPEAAGTPGFWTEGNPALGQAATYVRASFLNGLQSELLNILTAAGITPSKTTYDQLLSALRKQGVIKGLQRNTSNGSFVVPAGVTTLYVSACAGGAGGAGGSGGGTANFVGGGGGGGGAGQWVLRQAFAVTPGSTISWTIGTGGTAGTTTTGAGTAGGAGGNTVITGMTAGTLTLLGATGPNPGSNQVNNAGGGSYAAGYPSGGYGQDSYNGAGGGQGGAGASCPFGGGGGNGRGAATLTGPVAGAAAVGFGAGGGGGGGYTSGTAGVGTGGAGGAGAPGIVIFEW